MADICCIPVMVGVGCLFGRYNCLSSNDESSYGNKTKVYSYECDDERPRRMTPYEYKIYCAHLSTYGGNSSDKKKTHDG